MLKLKTCIRTELLRLPFRKALVMAAEMGVDGVEINARTEIKPSELSQTGIRHIKKLLEDHRLSVGSVQFPTRRGYGDPGQIDIRVDATKAAMKMAFELGCPHVSNFVGIPGDLDSNPLFTDTMTELALWGQHVGARLAIRTG